jgi:hypothetical protein
LKRRVEALEKVVAGSEEVGLEALVRYSMHPHLYDAETARRIEESRLWRLAQESAARGGSEPRAATVGSGSVPDSQEPKRPSASHLGSANGISLEQQVAQSYREPIAEPRKPEPPALIKAEPASRSTP